MRIRYYIKEITNEGRLINPQRSGGSGMFNYMFDKYNGYKTREDALRVLEEYFEQENRDHKGRYIEDERYTIVEMIGFRYDE